jgi:hypothetical protein
MQKFCIPRADCRRMQNAEAEFNNKNRSSAFLPDPAGLTPRPSVSLLSSFNSESWSLRRPKIDGQSRPILLRLSSGAEVRRRDLLIIRDGDDHDRAAGLDPTPQ